MLSLPDAVIFDFDGVLVNSEALHHEAFRRVLRPLGLDMTWEEYNRDYLGFDDRGAFRARFAAAGRGLDEVDLQALVMDKGRTFLQVTRELGAIPCPGAFELARALRGRVPLACAAGPVART